MPLSESLKAKLESAIKNPSPDKYLDFSGLFTLEDMRDNHAEINQHFSNIKYCRELYLSNIELWHFPPDALVTFFKNLCGLQGLRHLRLYNTHLNMLPEDLLIPIFEAISKSALQHLNLSHASPNYFSDNDTTRERASFTVIVDLIGHMQNLETLNFWNNALSPAQEALFSRLIERSVTLSDIGGMLPNAILQRNGKLAINQKVNAAEKAIEKSLAIKDWELRKLKPILKKLSRSAKTLQKTIRKLDGIRNDVNATNVGIQQKRMQDVINRIVMILGDRSNTASTLPDALEYALLIPKASTVARFNAALLLYSKREELYESKMYAALPVLRLFFSGNGNLLAETLLELDNLLACIFLPEGEGQASVLGDQNQGAEAKSEAAAERNHWILFILLKYLKDNIPMLKIAKSVSARPGTSTSEQSNTKIKLAEILDNLPDTIPPRNPTQSEAMLEELIQALKLIKSTPNLNFDHMETWLFLSDKGMQKLLPLSKETWHARTFVEKSETHTPLSPFFSSGVRPRYKALK